MAAFLKQITSYSDSYQMRLPLEKYMRLRIQINIVDFSQQLRLLWRNTTSYNRSWIQKNNYIFHKQQKIPNHKKYQIIIERTI